MVPANPSRSLRQSASSWARAGPAKGLGAAHTREPNTAAPAMPCSFARASPANSSRSTSSQRHPWLSWRRISNWERQRPASSASPAALRPSLTTSAPRKEAVSASSTRQRCSTKPLENSTSSWGSHSRSAPASNSKLSCWRAQAPAGLSRERPTLPYTFWAVTLVSRAALPAASAAPMVI